MGFLGRSLLVLERLTGWAEEHRGFTRRAGLGVCRKRCVNAISFHSATAQTRDRPTGSLRPPLVPSIAIV